MPETRELITLALVAIGACLILLSWRQILEALERFRGGGPRPPTHPLPGGDGFILRRRRRQASF
jgi:hypothetical protein